MPSRSEAREERLQHGPARSFFSRFDLSRRRPSISTRLRLRSRIRQPERESTVSMWKNFVSMWRRQWTSMRSRFNNGERQSQPATTISPPDTPTAPRPTNANLQILSGQLLSRFQCSGDPSDLQQATTILQELVESTSISDDLHHVALRRLGVALSLRFQHLGELSDLEDGISKLRVALELIPHGHSSRPGCLCNLGTSLKNRFKCLGRLADIEESISMLKNAVDLTPRENPDAPRYLDSLAGAFLSRFMRLGVQSDLEEAISRQRDIVDPFPDDDPDKPGFLNNLGISLRISFEQFRDQGDLEEAISILRSVSEVTPDDHPDKPGYLNNLGTSIFLHFEQSRKPDYLEEAISTLRVAIDLTPHDHPDKLGYLGSLSSCLVSRFEHLGELGDLQDAILIQQRIVDLTPDSHPQKPAYLSALGSSFFARFEHSGELNDIGDAISILGNALDLIPHDHTTRPLYLNDLGSFLFIRFKRFGELSNLEDAIAKQRDAVDLTLRCNPNRPSYLVNLGISCFTRFQLLQELNDLEDAILSFKDAIDVFPSGHPHILACLNSLGVSLGARFETLGEPNDIEDSVSTLRKVVDLSQFSDPRKASHLNNLSISLFARFQHHGEQSDLEDAVLALRDAVDFTPQGHPGKAIHLNNLGNSLVSLFKHLGRVDDLGNAILVYMQAVHLTPRGHPDQLAFFNNLGDCFVTRFECFGEPSDLDHAISLYSHAAFAPFGSTHFRFRASQKWILCARHARHYTLLHAYSVAIALFPQLAWIGLSLTRRYSEILMHGADVVREAAAAALDSGLPETAVEWLEQGRSIVWGELSRLRDSHEELSAAHPDHARRLREISSELEHTGASCENPLYLPLEQIQGAPGHATEPSRQEVDKYRVLAIKRDQLLQEIRRLPGFEGFLRRKQFSWLRASAHAGPVVMLNAAEKRCDALIILPNVDHVIHVPLHNFTLEQSVRLRGMLKSFVRHIRVGQSAPWGGPSWEIFLSPLWKCVAKPVLDALAFSTPEAGDLSRIFWCPTGPFTFLPIHAAGFYDEDYIEPGHKVFDYVVSSYVPSLATLIPSPDHTLLSSNDSLRLLVVRQPPLDGQSRLPGVITELAHIKDVIKNLPPECTTIVESSLGTVEEVLELMKNADWVHFACHGAQDGVNSGLCLAHGRRLTVRDMIALSRPYGGLAFLSACKTAKGEELLSDEALHIAAGMLFAGYGGVVGTMWSISDKLAPDVAAIVYHYLFRNRTRPDYREGARALHEAIAYVRESGVSFDDWVPFIHVGI